MSVAYLLRFSCLPVQHKQSESKQQGLMRKAKYEVKTTLCFLFVARVANEFACRCWRGGRFYEGTISRFPCGLLPH